jgi:hypothetical protein
MMNEKEIICHICPQDSEYIRNIQNFRPVWQYLHIDKANPAEIGKAYVGGLMLRFFADIEVEVKETYKVIKNL